MTKEIKLTRGFSTIVDDDDFEWLSKSNWHCNANGYAVRKASKKFGRQKDIFMHREIIKTPDGMETDHINGNKLDNRKDNLRICTHAENGRNAKMRKDNTSGYKGVYFHKRDKHWVAQIDARKKQIFLGYFNTAQEAASAYDEAAKKMFGEFAKLNFDDKDH